MTDLSGISDDALLSALMEARGRGGSKRVQDMSNDELIAAIKSDPSVPADMIMSLGSGLVKGGAGAVGIPDFATDMVGRGLDWVTRKAIGDEAFDKLAAKRAAGPQPIDIFPSAQTVQSAIERNVTGPLHEPQTQYGKYAGKIGEYTAGAVAGPGGVARNVLRFGVLPGLADEFAGQQVEGTAAEPYVRAGAGIAAGLGAAAVSRPTNVQGSVSRATRGVTDAQLDAAETLFLEAQRQGIPITRAEALQHATNGGTQLGNLQRVVEGQGGLREFFSQRPGQVDIAARGQFDNLAPQNPAPSTIGPQIGEAATAEINSVRDQINAISDRYYQAAANVRLSPADTARMRALPGFAEARDAILDNPQLARYVQGLPQNSVGFLNEVKKYLDTAAENAAGTFAQNRNMQVSAGYGSDAAAVRQIGERASPEYAFALDTQRDLRERFLEPLRQGYLGKLAEKDPTTQRAIDVLFPRNPLANSEQEIGQAVSTLAGRNSRAARDLVRAHAESVFNEATQRLTGGANEFGGAKFAAAIRGNPQQAANLEAAVRALPNGDNIWQGFNRFLDVLEAQGTRQRIGSQTAFNQEALQDLRRGGVVGETATLAAGAGVKLPARIKDAVERWRMGRNVDQLAHLLTAPEAAGVFRSLVRAPLGSSGGTAAFIRLSYIAEQANRESSKQPPKP